VNYAEKIATLAEKYAEFDLDEDEFRSEVHRLTEWHIVASKLEQGDIYTAEKGDARQSFVAGTTDHCDSPKLWHIIEGTWGTMEYWTKQGYSDFTKFTRHES
jgi:hypothetical protein